MTETRHTDAELRAILARTRTIAAVGVSLNEVRPSFYVARYLKRRGYDVIPVNPRYAGAVAFGETVVEGLAAIPAERGEIHMVDVFRRSDQAGAVVDEAIETLLPRGLSTVWLQIGVIDEAAGLTVVMNRCPKIEYQRLNGELSWGGFNTGVVSSRRPGL